MIEPNSTYLAKFVLTATKGFNVMRRSYVFPSEFQEIRVTEGMQSFD